MDAPLTFFGDLAVISPDPWAIQLDPEAFDPAGTYAAMMPATEGAVDLLKQHACFVLPPAIRYEIRGTPPGDFGREKMVAWYTVPADFAAQEAWEPLEAPYFDHPTGNYVIDRCVT